jgi:hypothetical protein
MHLVQQHTLDIQCFSSPFGKEIQNQLDSLLENQFYPKLEILFDKYAVDNHIWNIELLSLELPTLSSKNWKKELIDHSLLQIEEYLKNNISFFESDTNNHQNSALQAFITNKEQLNFLFFQFLRTGVLAENSISKSLVDIVSKIEISIGFLEELIQNLLEDSTCFERWVFSIPSFFKKMCMDSLVGFQFISVSHFQEIVLTNETDLHGLNHFKQQFKANKTFFLQWFELIEWTNYIQKKYNSKQLLYKNFIELSEKHWAVSLPEISKIFKILFENSSAENKVIFQEMSVFVESYNRNDASSGLKNDYKKSIDSPFDKNSEVTTSKNISTGETLFVTNAGLVILHPFLKSLFEQLHLFENDIWTTKMSQHKAILLTQFMITGEEQSFENELVLNKILCGFPLESVVNTQLKITKKEKEKCYSLLQAVSEHWKAMSKSSVAALQESFLQRNGKIVIQSESRFELWVEEKGFDILLEQLPWGIGMVKTPWMQEYLICNWS